MRFIIVIWLALFVAVLSAQIEMPETHLSIMLDGKLYSGERANDGSYDFSNRFQLRKAELSLKGKLTDRTEYSTALGMCTCSGSGNQVDIMEAEIYYNWIKNLQIGIRKGHPLRGYASRTECGARLATEKPNFMNTFGACHPLGFVANYTIEMGDIVELETEASLMNGISGVLDGEHDYNLGTMLQTPLTGLSISAMFNHTAQKYYDSGFNQYSDDGYRFGGGLEYLANSVWLTSEYQKGKGFERNDQKMEAWYAQFGYEVNTGLKIIPTIQPYVFYENWNKDIRDNSIYTFLETGISIKTSANSALRFAYKTNVSKPQSAVADPDLFLFRLQTSI